MRTFISLFLLSFSFGLRAEPLAPPVQKFEPIHVSNLQSEWAQKGFYVTVLYVRGQRPDIGAPGDRLIVNEVRAVGGPQRISSARDVNFSAVNVPQAGSQIVSFMVFIVHKQQNAFWQNPPRMAPPKDVRGNPGPGETAEVKSWWLNIGQFKQSVKAGVAEVTPR